MAETFQPKADYSQVKRELDTLVQAYLKVADAQQKVISATARVDAQYGVTVDIVTELTATHEKLTSTIRRNKDELRAMNGEYDIQTKKLEQVAQAENKAAVAAENAAAERARAAALTQKFVTSLPAPQQRASTTEAAAVQVQIDALQKVVAQHKIAETELRKVWSNIEQGRVVATGYGDDLKALHTVLLRLSKAHGNLGSEADKAAAALKKESDAIADQQRKADQLNKELQEQARLKAQGSAAAAGLQGTLGSQLSGTTVVEQQRYFNELNRLSELAAKHNVTAAQVNQIWRELSSGNIKRYEGELNEVQKQIIAVAQAHQNNAVANAKAQRAEARAAEARKRSLQAEAQQLKDIRISWESIFRLLAVQLAHRAVAQLANALERGVEASLALEKSIREIRTISQINDQPFENWARDIRLLSDEYARAQGDIAEGFYQALSNQVAEGTQTILFMNEALRFSIASTSSTEASVNLLTSTINSFNLAASDAADVSAILFKTIELGRVRAEDMANSFGRIGPLANQLGIQLPELAAAIDAMTIQGLRFDNASTLIRATLLKLIRPSEDMKELFNELGVTSAEAAIQTYGLVGLLDQIKEVTKGSSDELGRLFNRLRAIQGSQLLLSNATKAFNDDLAELTTQSVPSYLEAVARATDSAGFTIEQALTRLRNVFISDVGFAISEAIVNSADSLEELEQRILSYVGVISQVIVAYSAYKIATLAIQTTVARLTTVYTTVINQTFSFASALKIATGSIGAILGAYTLLKTQLAFQRLESIRAFSEAQQAGQQSLLDFVSDTDTYLGQASRLWRSYWIAIQRDQLRTFTNYRIELNNLIRGVDSILEDNVKALEKLGEAAITAIQRTADETAQIVEKAKNSQLDAQEEFFKNQVEYNSKLQEIFLGNASPAVNVAFNRRIITQLTQQRVQLERRLAAEANQLRNPALAGADLVALNAQIDRDQDRIALVQAEINRAKEDILKARQDAQKELEKLNTEAQKLEDKAATEIKPEKRLAIEAELEKNNEARREQQRIIAQTRGVEQALVRDLQQQNDVLRQGYIIDGRRAQAAARIAEQEKARATATREAFQELVTYDYTKAGTAEDVTAILQQQLNNIVRLLGSDASPETLLELTRFKVAQQTLAYERDAETLRQQAIASIERQVKLRERESELIREQVDLLKGQLTESESRLQDILNGIKTIDPRLRRGTIDGSLATDVAGVQRNLANTRYAKDLQTYIIDIERFRELITKDPTEENLTQVLEVYQRIRAATLTIAEFAQGSGAGIGLYTEQDVAEFTKRFTDLRDAFGTAVNAFTEVARTRAQISSGKAAMQDLLDQIKELESPRIRESVQSLEDFNTSLGDISGALQDAIKNVRDLSEELRNIPATRIGQENGMHGGYFAFGGRVGRDTIAAMLSPGEFVVNPTTSRRFYSQLKSMNSGLEPRYYAQGGATSFGDINVNVNGGPTAGVTARDIGNALRREMSRGSFRF